MVNPALGYLLKSVLGKGTETARSNMKFMCPFCKHHKPKLEITLNTNEKKENPWHCWVCHAKGKTVSSLFKKVNAPQSKKDELKLLIKPSAFQPQNQQDKIQLPAEFKSLATISKNDFSAKLALNYVVQRGITKEDIIKYNIGYCERGQHVNRIIIPSYNENGELNYYVSRSYDETTLQKYKNPKVSRDIIGFEFFINWNVPIILCEGAFDAIAIKRNVIPLLSTNISNELMKKIVTSSVKKIYIALDNDAMKLALKYAHQLMNAGKEIYLVQLGGKDASEIGFEAFTNIIQHTEPLTFQDLITKKLEL